MSAGGALGGLFTALLAPVIFDWVWEHPILVLAAAALLPNRPLFAWMDRLGLDRTKRRIAILVLLLAAMVLSLLLNRWLVEQNDALVLLGMLAIAWCGILLLGHRWAVVAVLAMLMLGRGGYQTLWASIEGTRERSYFGIYTVREQDYAGLRGLRELTHGTTLHGLQFTDPAERREPTTYYGRDSGVGAALGVLPQLAGPEARVGVVGLGVGTLACYREPGQAWDFFEIDPEVVDFSRGEDGFTFLRECTPDAPIHIGDARLVLEQFPRRRSMRW
jgi:hypothetical protein